jgi:hypothetical protein
VSNYNASKDKIDISYVSYFLTSFLDLPTSAIVTSNPSNALSLFAPPPQQVAFQTWSSQNVVLNISGGEA